MPDAACVAVWHNPASAMWILAEIGHHRNTGGVLHAGAQVADDGLEDELPRVAADFLRGAADSPGGSASAERADPAFRAAPA
jgi:hypothetical protein